MAGILVLALRLALTLSLYTFLTWVILTLWRDLRAKSQAIAERRVPPIHLQPLDERAESGYHFNRTQVTLGRNPACDCVLEDETVSSYHARLVYRDNQWWLEDLGSTNGSFIDGQRATTPVVITSSDRLRFGQLDFLVTIEELS